MKCYKCGKPTNMTVRNTSGSMLRNCCLSCYEESRGRTESGKPSSELPGKGVLWISCVYKPTVEIEINAK